MEPNNLPPCPVCGKPGRILNITTDGERRLALCDKCDLAINPADWHRLADNAALRRALQVLEAWLLNNSMHNLEICKKRTGEVAVTASIGAYAREREIGPFLTALIALAERLEESDG